MYAVLLGLAACQTVPRPAVLAESSPATLEALTGVLADATGRARIELGPGDPTRQPAISVLPPPPGIHEGNSTLMPAIFDLVLVGGDCFVRAREGGGLHALPGVECRPVQAGR